MIDVRKLLVYGSAEFGQVVREHALACGFDFAGFVDDWHTGPDIVGDFDTARDRYSYNDYVIALAIGYRHLAIREEVTTKIRNAGFEMPPLIHPEAFIARSSNIAFGCIVMARASVDMRVSLGPLCVIWPGAVISHDCIFDGNSFVSPNATVCGHCRIGRRTFLGAGSIVIDHVEVPNDSFVKAGGVFTSPLLNIAKA